MLNQGFILQNERKVISVSGPDSVTFLQNLITNDIGAPVDSLIYSALLTPQGKYLFDFFVLRKSQKEFLIDIASEVAEDFIKRLKIYQLRSHVELDETNINVFIGFGEKPASGFFDPRCCEMGWRFYCSDEMHNLEIKKFDKGVYDDLRVKLCIPETGIELIQGKTLILEAGFERLSGVSFTKGCYIGQEVTARMKHKTDLKKGLALIEFKGDSKGCQSNNIESGGKVIGTVFTRANKLAIAYLNFRHLKSRMISGSEEIIRVKRL